LLFGEYFFIRHYFLAFFFLGHPAFMSLYALALTVLFFLEREVPAFLRAFMFLTKDI
jgi:hypothetical protein